MAVSAVAGGCGSSVDADKDFTGLPAKLLFQLNRIPDALARKSGTTMEDILYPGPNYLTEV